LASAARLSRGAWGQALGRFPGVGFLTCCGAAGRLALSVLLAGLCMPEIFGSEEQFRQAGQATGLLMGRACGIGRARGIGRAGILDLTRAAMRVRVARS
jgi:hypothetical protein